MKVTPFNALHKSLGAKMVEFGGFEMPVQYAGIMEEHAAVRNAAGVFDVSHMGEFEVRGRDAVGFLQRVTVNDVSRLTEGKAQYSAMCNVDGGIVDDLLIYHFGDRYMLVVNASNIGKDFAWLKSNLKGDVELTDVSDTIALLAIQGPRSLEILQHLTQVPLREIGYYTFKRGIVAGQDRSPVRCPPLEGQTLVCPPKRHVPHTVASPRRFPSAGFKIRAVPAESTGKEKRPVRAKELARSDQSVFRRLAAGFS